MKEKIKYVVSWKFYKTGQALTLLSDSNKTFEIFDDLKDAKEFAKQEFNLTNDIKNNRLLYKKFSLLCSSNFINELNTPDDIVSKFLAQITLKKYKASDLGLSYIDTVCFSTTFVCDAKFINYYFRRSPTPKEAKSIKESIAREIEKEFDFPGGSIADIDLSNYPFKFAIKVTKTLFEGICIAYYGKVLKITIENLENELNNSSIVDAIVHNNYYQEITQEEYDKIAKTKI